MLMLTFLFALKRSGEQVGSSADSGGVCSCCLLSTPFHYRAQKGPDVWAEPAILNTPVWAFHTDSCLQEKGFLSLPSTNT